MVSFRTIHILFASIFILVLLNSCQPDSPAELENLPQELLEEQKYYEDYRAPRYKWGFINRYNSLVISAKYDACRDFAEGLAAVNVDGKWGFINSSGILVIEPRYRAAYSFHHQIAKVQSFDRKYFLIDTIGRKLFDRDFQNISPFADGWAKYTTRSGNNYINLDGDSLLDVPVLHARNFKEGYAVISNGGKSGLIDKTGTMVLDFEYDDIEDVENGFALTEKGGQKGFFSASSNKSKLGIFDQLTRLQSDRAFAKKNEQWFPVDQNLTTSGIPVGRQIISIQAAGNDRWLVECSDGFGLLDRQGSFLTHCDYELIYKFQEARAPFLKNGFWGMLDIHGEETIPAVFGLIWGFREGLARASDRGGIGFIDSSGMFVIDPIHFEVRDFSEGFARVQVIR